MDRRVDFEFVSSIKKEVVPTYDTTLRGDSHVVMLS